MRFTFLVTSSRGQYAFVVTADNLESAIDIMDESGVADETYTLVKCDGQAS